MTTIWGGIGRDRGDDPAPGRALAGTGGARTWRLRCTPCATTRFLHLCGLHAHLAEARASERASEGCARKIPPRKQREKTERFQAKARARQGVRSSIATESSCGPGGGGAGRQALAAQHQIVSRDGMSSATRQCPRRDLGGLQQSLCRQAGVGGSRVAGHTTSVQCLSLVREQRTKEKQERKKLRCLGACQIPCLSSAKQRR